MTERPWKVHVFDIGPNFSFTHEVNAHVRAAELTSPDGDGRYAKVSVYDARQFPLTRTLYFLDKPTRRERFTRDGWVPA